MKKGIKGLVLNIFYRYYIIKSIIGVKIFGINTLIAVIEKLPEVFIIPFMTRFGLVIGTNCRIMPGILFNNLSGDKPFSNLKIENNVYIGRNVLFDLSESIIIGSNSMFGAGVQIWTHVGDFSYDSSDYCERRLDVNIGEGVLCWARVIISPGVSIGNYSRVAAGSVVINNIESKVFYGGVPAKLIRKRDI